MSMNRPRLLRRQSRWPLIALVAALFVAPPAWCQAPAPALSKLEQRIADKTNQMRQESGLPRLQVDPRLSQVAREHSADMMRRSRVTHESPIAGRRTPEDRYALSFGRAPGKLSENVVAVEPTFSEEALFLSIHGQLSLTNDGFRNAVDPDVTMAGVGCVVGPDGRVWATVIFARPAGSPPPAHQPAIAPGRPPAIVPRLPPDPRPDSPSGPPSGPPSDLPPPAGTVRYEGTLREEFIASLRRRYEGQNDMHSATVLSIRCSPLWMDLLPEKNSVVIGPVVMEYVLQYRGPNYPAEPVHIRHELSFLPDVIEDGTGMKTDMRFYVSYQAKVSSATEVPGKPLRWEAREVKKGLFEAQSSDYGKSEETRDPKYGKSGYTGILALVEYASDRIFVLKPLGMSAQRPTPAAAPAPAEPAATPAVAAEPEAPATSAAEDRAADIRWLRSIDEALATAERKLIQARDKLIEIKEFIRQREQRIAYLESLLTKPRTPESDGVIESIIRMGIDAWDEATMGPSPPLGARPREVIQDQIDRLKQQVSDARKEQDELIANTLETYYDPIAEELEARGPGSNWEEIRKSAKEAIREVISLKGLAEAELYLAAGQDEKFQAAVQASITDGRHAADAHYLEALYFLDKGDLRRALDGFHLVMDLTKRPGGPGAPVTTREQAEAIADQGDPLWQQARRMAGMVEDGYLQAVDAKASAEAQQAQGEVADRMKAGGDEGWLGGVLSYLQMGVVTSTSAIVHKEDALVNLAAKYEKEVASQHCGLLLMQSLHERGFPLEAIDRLTNEQFLGVMREYYGDAGAKLEATDGVQLRAAVKAALRNPDVSRLVSGSKEALRVDTGRDYFGHEALAETSLDSWSSAALMAADVVSIANVAMMVMPTSTYRISGKVAGVRYTGVLGEAEAGATVQTAREGFLAATRLDRLPALLEETKAGQIMVGQARQFLATSGWTKKRALEIATFVAAGKTGEAVGGTIGVMRGTDGKTESEAGKMVAELFTMWTVGDADALKEAAEAHGITPEQLGAVAKKAGVEAKAAEALTAVNERSAATIREALPPEPGAGITAEGRQAGAKMKEGINAELQDMRHAIAQGSADANTFRRFTELGVNFRAASALETGAEPEVRAWLEHVEKLAKEGEGRTLQTGSVAQAADDAKVQLAASNAGSASPEAPSVDFLQAGMPTLRSGNPLTKDLDEKWIAGQRAEALAGYRERYAIVQHMGLKDAPAVKAAGFPQRIGALRGVVEKGAAIKQMSKPEWVPSYTEKVTTEEVARLEAGLHLEEPTVRLEPIAKDPLHASFSDPYWVMAKNGDDWVKIGVFKRSGEGFRDGLQRGADLEAEEIYARFAKEFSTDLGVEVPACTRAPMTVETRIVETVGGVKTLKEVLPPQLQEGLFVRWAPGVDLEKLGPLATGLFSKQIALDKVLAALFFDHDRKAGNYLVMELEKLLSVDHSMAVFRDTFGELLYSDKLVAEQMEKAATHWRNRAEVRPKDLYRFLDEQITVEDMESSIGFIENLFKQDAGRARVRAILLDSLKSETAADEAMRLLTTRARLLRKVLTKCFGTVQDLKPLAMNAPLPAGPSEPSRWFDSDWQKAIWAEELALAA